MTSKNKIDVKVRGKGNTTVAVGGSMGNISPNKSENEVRILVEGENLVTTAIGGNVEQSVLSKFRELLVPALQNKDDQDDASDILTQLDEQANKPSEERNESKIKRLLDSLGSYVSLVSITISNVEKVKLLYDQTIKFFGF